MKKTVKKLIIAVVLTGHWLLVTGHWSFAAFNDPGYMARPIGMGGAFVAIADDANTAWYNPAGVARVAGQSALFTYSRPFSGLDGVDINLSYASYLRAVSELGGMSVGWAHLGTPGLYEENTYLVTYGHTVASTTFGLTSVGVSLKYLQHGVVTDERTVDDPVFAGGSMKGAFSADVGILQNWAGGMTTGVCAKDVNQPDVGFGGNDPVPAEYLAGAADTFIIEGVGEITASLAVSYRDKTYNAHAGGELWLCKHTVAARLGGNRNEAAIGASYLRKLSKTGPSIETHYSFSWPFALEGTGGSHRLTLGLQF